MDQLVANSFQSTKRKLSEVAVDFEQNGSCSTALKIHEQVFSSPSLSWISYLNKDKDVNGTYIFRNTYKGKYRFFMFGTELIFRAEILWPFNLPDYMYGQAW